MSKKAFVVWGLVIIQIYVTLIAIALYLAFSKIIDIKALAPVWSFGMLLFPIVSFGIILYLRSKTVARSKRIWALCIPLFLVFAMVGSWLCYLYFTTIVMESSAQHRFFRAIANWAETNESGATMSWTVKQKLDYILVMLPQLYLGKLGFFALLWFGSLDPRFPGKNKPTHSGSIDLTENNNSAINAIKRMIPGLGLRPFTLPTRT